MAPSPCVAMMAVDFTLIGGRVPDVVKPGHEAMERRLHWWEPGNREPFVWSSGMHRLQDRRDTIAAIAPVSIFRLPAEDVADVLLGFIDYVVYLNDQILELMFARKGIQARVARPPESQRVFLAAARQHGQIEIPASVRQQLMMELMTPATLITSVDGALAAAARRKDRSKWLIVFDDETSVWGGG